MKFIHVFPMFPYQVYTANKAVFDRCFSDHNAAFDVYSHDMVTWLQSVVSRQGSVFLFKHHML